ncbi:DNA translocase FtsK [Desulfothermus sp.]
MEKGNYGNKLVREIWSLTLLFVCIFLFLSIFSYSPKDPSFNVATSITKVRNFGGIIGAYLGGLVVELFGNVSWLVPFLFLWSGLCVFLEKLRLRWYRIVGLFFLILFLLMFFASKFGNSVYIKNIHGGGYIGNWLFSMTNKYFSFGGTLLVWTFLIVIGVQLTFLFLWKDIFRYIGNVLFISLKWIKNVFCSREKNRTHFKSENSKNESISRQLKILNKEHNETKKEIISTKKDTNTKKQKKQEYNKKEIPIDVETSYPSVDLLDPLKNQDNEIDTKYFDDMSNRLIACLKDFGVEGELLNIKPGPVVTMFEFRPAPGIKISKIAQLNNDLALALKAVAVRIEAPIPGKDYIGIEIPNKNRKIVYFREIVQSKVFQQSKANLPIVLGQDIQGRPRVEDLARMPHLLVAGATGAGKSVCLNSIIISLLMRFSPEDVKFLLIDPKRIEMASYSQLPHLIHPVVVDMELAKTALEWAVSEMEYRYDKMAEIGARNIYGYNEKIKKGDIQDSNQSPMPYLVIVIDEMADLMLTAGKEAEAKIIRLAQLARAAGIHLILATQRPSVDVVTGLIKANFPARVAFQVTSKHDSRTILDNVGAEHLLGKGDMLFKPPAGRIQRIHGAYISDGEINRIIKFWEQKYPKTDHMDLKEWKIEKEQDKRIDSGDDEYSDPLYQDAVKFVMEQDRISISMLQRYLRIGFNKAARFVEMMEKEGIIGPQEGSKPRIVIKK